MLLLYKVCLWKVFTFILGLKDDRYKNAFQKFLTVDQNGYSLS